MSDATQTVDTDLGEFTPGFRAWLRVRWHVIHERYRAFRQGELATHYMCHARRTPYTWRREFACFQCWKEKEGLWLTS